jgi:hypothetical protein
LEASVDYQLWSEVGQVLLTGGVGQFQEAIASGASQRFYRLKN